ncbi:NIPSNAP family protein [Sphingosinicella sp. BN140058]|uniref:NIPSNAP family protein n=1 Tax=Sphingosinicella sp. BN140058 TaxID=1892855 RepID=UPI0019822EFC|nr:NIPSNAP family protein [Sphingosinicella sp. BN140058]
MGRRSSIASLAAAPLVLGVSPGAGQSREGRSSNIVELRQYTLRGGQRDRLIRLFEREFIVPQAAVGAPVLGVYRDLDDPDRFVWLRGFDTMDQRASALSAFYDGPVWRAHRDEANATMIDSDNVLLLRRSAGSAAALAPSAIVTANIHYLSRTDAREFTSFFQTRLLPRLSAAGATPLWILCSEPAPNSFPRLPVREGEPVFVWFSRWRTQSELARFDDRWSRCSGWRDDATADLLPALMRKPERLRLQPVI